MRNSIEKGERPPRWVYVAFASFWVLLLVNFVDYYIRYQRINPLGLLLLVVVVVGSILGPRWLKQPLFTEEGMKERLVFMAFLLGAVVGFTFAVLVVMQTYLK